MKHLKGFATLLLYSIISWSSAVNAAQESFEINLKELRPAPGGAPRTQQRSTGLPDKAKSLSPVEAARPEGSSIYTVRPGDHIFAILMHRYKLSNEAAERLIPEVMRLNNIRNPQGLTVGHRLTIPLPPPPERPAKITRKKPQQTAPVPAEPAAPASAHTPQPQPPAPKTDPQLPVKSTADQKQAPARAALREASIKAAPACILAQEILKQLNLLVPPTKLIMGQETLTAEHAGMKVVIACGLSSDKIYTYERLLALHDMQLLPFTGTEQGSRVIRKLANRLSLSYTQSDAEANGNQPPSYLFSAIGPNGQDIRITIADSGHEN